MKSPPRPLPRPKEPLNFPQGGSEAVSNLCSLVLGKPHRNSPGRALMSLGASHFLPGACKGPQSSMPIVSSCTTGPDRKTEAQEVVRSSKTRIDKFWVLGDQWHPFQIFFFSRPQ